jgi:Zn-dependent peptidase ImmA (M78 family)
MGKNYLSVSDQKKIDAKLNVLMLDLHKSYPENNLIDIIQTAVPGIKVYEDDFDGDSSVRGVIYKKSDQYKVPMIVIQKHLPPTAKTFALAHEFGHYILDHPGTKNYLFDKIDFDGSNKQQREAEAQYFAASLLMPKDKFEWLANAVKDDDILARRFGVSTAAVKVRRDWLRTNG